MARQRAYVRRNVANNNVEIEVPQVPHDPLAKQVNHSKFLATFQVFSQAMKAQANREVNVLMKPNMCTMMAKIRDFTRMNPSEFHGSKVEEDPQEFIDEVYKIVGYHAPSYPRDADTGPRTTSDPKLTLLA
uniref:Gag-pol polyprotein n=1 Tax=Solanum tuberosum TaxID=4113 RepID=M1E052_SOLTU